MSLFIHLKVNEGSVKLLFLCIKRNVSTRVLSVTWSGLTWSILNPKPGRMQGSFWQIPVPLRAVPPVTLPEVRGQGRPVALKSSHDSPLAVSHALESRWTMSQFLCETFWIMEIRHSQDESEHVTDAAVLNISTWLSTANTGCVFSSQLCFMRTMLHYRE